MEELNFKILQELAAYNGKDIEAVANKLYIFLRKFAASEKQFLVVYFEILNSKMETLIFVKNKHEVILKDKWIFLVLLISSVRNMKIFNQPDDFDCLKVVKAFFSRITTEILGNVRLLDARSLYLLKVLDQIVQKKAIFLDNDMKNKISQKMLCVKSSPIKIVRQVGSKILETISSEYICPRLSSDPYENVQKLLESKEHISSCTDDEIFKLLPILMENIACLFRYNIHGKRASIMYNAVISRYQFDDFTQKIWPTWLKYFVKIESIGDFHQSLVKYWIPLTVNRFQLELYNFLKTQKVHGILMVEILHETRRKSLISAHDLLSGNNLERVNIYLENRETRYRMLEVMSIILNTNEEIVDTFLNILMKITSNTFHSGEFTEILAKFLNHIAYIEHVKKKSNPEYAFEKYTFFIKHLIERSKFLLEDSSTAEFGAKLCSVIMDTFTCGSKDLGLKYTSCEEYENEKNLYYLHLQETGIFYMSTGSDAMVKLLEKQFVKLLGNCPNILDLLLKRFLEHVHLMKFFSFNPLDPKSPPTLNTLNSRIAYYRIKIHRAYKVDPSQIRTYIIHASDSIKTFLERVPLNDDHIDELFELAFAIEYLMICGEVASIHEAVLSFAMESLIFMLSCVDTPYQMENMTCRGKKIVEYILNRFTYLLTCLGPHTVGLFKNDVLSILFEIVEKSQLKKHNTLAVTAIGILCNAMATDPKHFISRKILFSKVMRSVTTKGFYHDTRLRRQPETRAVLYAICKSYVPDQKEFVTSALNLLVQNAYQINIDDSVVATLECMEILIAEPQFHRITAGFCEDVMRISLKAFNNNSWPVRNAALQLTRSIMNRFLGVPQGFYYVPVRSRTIQEICFLFPKIMDYFYESLRSNLNEESIVILQYFSASTILDFDYIDSHIKATLTKFVILFKNIICTSEHSIVKFVVNAYAGLCLVRDISSNIKALVNKIISKINDLSNNILMNLLILINALLSKLTYTMSFKNSAIEPSLLQLGRTLRKKKRNICILYCINYNTFEECMKSTKILLDNFKDTILCRICLKNYVNFLLANCGASNLCNSLRLIYSRPLPFFIHDIVVSNVMKVIEIYTDRVPELFHIILNEFFKLEGKSGSEILLNKYAELIANINQHFQVGLSGFMEKTRLTYTSAHTIPRVVINNIILASVDDKEDIDIDYLDSLFTFLFENNDLNELDIDLITSTLSYFHKNMVERHKQNFLKYMISFLVRDCDKSNIVDFISTLIIDKSEHVTEDNCFKALLDIDTLYNILGDNQTVLTFLQDLEQLLSYIVETDKNIEIDTFYTGTSYESQNYLDIVSNLYYRLKYSSKCD